MGLEPVLGTGDDLIELFGLRIADKCRLAMLLVHPQDGIVGIAVDDLVCYSLPLHQGQGVDDGKELSDVVRPQHGAEMKHLLPGLQVDTPVFHRSGVAGTGGIDSPGSPSLRDRGRLRTCPLLVICSHFILSCIPGLAVRPSQLPSLISLSRFFLTASRQASSPFWERGGTFPYILSGTSMPSSAIPFLMTFATFFAKTSRVIFSASVSALRML